MGYRVLLVAVFISFQTPVFALTPTEQYYCCQHSDIRAGQCSRFELTPERCSEIRAGFARAQDQQIVIPRLLDEARRKEMAMHDAIEKNNVEAVRSLLTERKENPRGISDLPLSPMFLIRSARFGRGSIVDELLAAGVNVNGGDADKRTALMHASDGGHIAVVQRLLKAGGDVNLKSMWGETALSFAKKLGNEEIVLLLTSHGAKDQP